jgi:hypothetical protein
VAQAVPRRADAGVGSKPFTAAPLSPERSALLDESAARAILAAEFRRAGLRILRDQKIAVAGGEVTLDGYDPERQIGYEYIAAEETGIDLSAEERRALEHQALPAVLIIDATDEAELRRRAQQFLAKLPPRR